MKNTGHGIALALAVCGKTRQRQGQVIHFPT
jgi:hypothetical protein